MLTAAELTDLQSVQSDTFLETCVIKTRTTVSDGAGGHTESAITVATEPCRLAPTELSRGEERFADRLQSSVPYKVTMRPGADVKLSYWFEIGGRVFDPMAIRGPRTFQTAVNVLCKERKT
jgi:hypothetical protein